MSYGVQGPEQGQCKIKFVPLDPWINQSIRIACLWFENLQTCKFLHYECMKSYIAFHLFFAESSLVFTAKQATTKKKWMPARGSMYNELDLDQQCKFFLDKGPISNLNCKHSPDISDKPWEMFQPGNESAIRQYRPLYSPNSSKNKEIFSNQYCTQCSARLTKQMRRDLQINPSTFIFRWHMFAAKAQVLNWYCLTY